jgi:hypothetical protein
LEERHRRPDRELEVKVQNLQETVPCSATHAVQLESEQRALRFALGEKVSLSDAVPGQCRDC